MAVSSETLLYPELLSNEQLIAIIQERHLRVPHIVNASREELLAVFHQFCVPFGQRKYRDSGRGKVLNKNRHIDDTSRMEVDAGNCNTSRKHSHPLNSDRMKPPPDLLSGHLKRIKINMDNMKTNNSEGINKRKIVITSNTEPEGNPPVKRGRKPITWP